MGFWSALTLNPDPKSGEGLERLIGAASYSPPPTPPPSPLVGEGLGVRGNEGNIDCFMFI